MVQLMEMSGTNGPVKVQHPKLRSKELLDIFTQLVDSQDEQRKSCTESLITFIADREQSTEEGTDVCGDTKYSTKRLVQGLSSGRRMARLGYSVSLCQLLRRQEKITTNLLFQFINQTAKAYGSQTNNKMTIRNACLGKVFAYLVLVQSKKLVSGDSDQISTVVQELMRSSTEKDYLPHICSVGVAQIISQVKHKVFQKYVFPYIEDNLTAGWAECTPDDLLLVIAAKKHHPKLMEPYLTDKWEDSDLLTEKTFHYVAEVLKRALKYLPVMHSVIDAIAVEVIQNEENLIPFWKKAICPLSTNKSANKSTSTQLYMFEKLIPLIKTSKQVEEVLYPTITSQLAKHNKDAVTKVMTFIKGVSNSKTQLSVLKCFVKHSDTPQYDVINEMIKNFIPEAVEKLKKEVTKAYTLQPSWIADKKDVVPWTKWCVSVMDLLLTKNDDTVWQLDILQFLFVHSFFSVTKSSDIPHCGTIQEKHPDHVRASSSQHFFKAVTRLLSHNTRGVARTIQFNQHLDVLYELVQYGQTLLQETETVQLETNNFNDEAREQWTKMFKCLPALQEKRTTSESLGINHAFELMFLYGSLQLFCDPSAVDFLQDLQECYKKTTKRRKSRAADTDEPEWIEVITELLLSLMFKGSLLSRNIAKTAMAYLANHVTPDALQLILDALQQTSLNDEEGMVGVEEDEEEEEMKDEEEEKNNSEDEKDDDDDKSEDELDKDDSSSSSSDDDDDEEEDDDDSGVEEEPGIDVPDEVKKQIKDALGDAAADSDDSSEDIKDFSDKEMFQLDQKLAEAFKAMNKTKNKKLDKERKKQLLMFKHRSFDLLEVIVKNNPSIVLMKDMIVPLLDRMEGGHRLDREQELGNKAKTIFDLIYKTKKMNPDSAADTDELLELFSNLMKLSRKVTTESMMTEVVKGCVMVVRMLLNLQGQTEPSPAKTRSRHRKTEKSDSKKKPQMNQDKLVSLVESGVMDMLQQKPGHCSVAFFCSLLEKIGLMFWPMSESLVTVISSSDVKSYNRSSALNILALLLEKQLVRELGPDEWGMFLTEIKSMAEKVLETALSKDKHLIKGLMRLFLKIFQVSTDATSVKILGDSEMKILQDMMSTFSHETLTMFRRIYKYVYKKDCPRQQKKRKIKVMNDEASSPNKKAKSDDESVVNGNIESSEESSITENTDEMETDNPPTASNGIQHKKKKKDNKLENSVETPDKTIKETPIENLAPAVDVEMPESLTASQKKKKRKSKGDKNTEEAVVNLNGSQLLESMNESKESEKSLLSPSIVNDSASAKKKKRKSKGVENTEAIVDLNGSQIHESMNESTIGNVNESVSAKKKKRKSKGVENTEEAIVDLNGSLLLESMNESKEKSLLSPSIENGSGSASAKKQKKRNSDKFSPRYTRSMKT